jgi:cell division protein FtsL
MPNQTIEKLEGKISILEDELRDVSEKINTSSGEERIKYIDEEKKLLIAGIRILKEIARG